MDNLKTLYNNSIEDILSSVSLSNKMQVPKLVKVSINMETARFEDSIHENDEVAFFPPMTGG